MNILVDAFGGDNAPLEIIKGAVEYKNEGGKEDVTLVGKQEIIENIIKENNFQKYNFGILNATEIITCEESPTEAIRRKEDSSIVVGLNKLRKKECDAFVSAGSTGALLTGAVLKVGRIKGVSRPALATVLPTIKGDKKVMLLDCGANADCKPINLVHFALMGDSYMKKVLGVKEPKIALLSNGTEDKKGNELNHTVLPILKNIQGINFVGNIEARDILSGEYDVIVADGFSGNIALKSLEGGINSLLKILKKNIVSSFVAKIGYIFMKKSFSKTRNLLDYNKTGGAVFLGVNGVMVKCHGSSKSTAIKSGLFQTEMALKNSVNEDIENRLNSEEIKNLVI